MPYFNIVAQTNEDTVVKFQNSGTLSAGTAVSCCPRARFRQARLLIQKRHLPASLAFHP